MKKAFAVMMMVLFLAGCGAAARESGFYEHNTMYRDWDHLKFSIYGYKTLEQKEIQAVQGPRLVGENHLGIQVVKPFRGDPAGFPSLG